MVSQNSNILEETKKKNGKKNIFDITWKTADLDMKFLCITSR